MAKRKESLDDYSLSDEEERLLAGDEPESGAAEAETGPLEEATPKAAAETAPVPAVETVEKSRYDDIERRWRETQAEQERERAHYRGLLEQAMAARQQPQQPQPDGKLPILDPSDPNWDPAANIRLINQALPQVMQAVAQMAQQQEAARQEAAAVQQLASYEQTFARQHPEYYERIDSFLDHQARSTAATHGVPYWQALQHHRQQMMASAGQHIAQGRNPYAYWNEALRNFGPAAGSPTPSGGTAASPAAAPVSSPAAGGGQPEFPAQNRMTSLSEGAAARQPQGGNGFSPEGFMKGDVDRMIHETGPNFMDAFDAMVRRQAGQD